MRGRCGLFPDFPGGLTAGVHVFKLLFVLKRIHARPEPVVAEGAELVVLGQTLERAGDEFFAVLDLIKNPLPENIEPAVDANIGTSDVAYATHLTVITNRYEVIGKVWFDAEKCGDPALLLREIDKIGQGHVAQPITVVGQEHFFAFEMVLYGLEPLSDGAVRAGVDKCNPPVLQVVVEQLDIVTAIGHDKIVQDALIIREEILFNHIGLVAETQDKVLVSEMGIVLHEVPQDRHVTNFYERLGEALLAFLQAHSETAAEQDNLHGFIPFTSLSHSSQVAGSTAGRIDPDLGYRHHEFSPPLADERQLLHDFVFDIPGEDDDVIGFRLSNLVRMINRDVCTGEKQRLFVRAAVHRIIDKVRAHAAVVQQRIALCRGAVADNRFAAALRVNQELQ